MSSIPPYFGTKVVSAEEMRRIEKLALAGGCSEGGFIQEAGRQVASVAMRLIEHRKLPKNVFLLIGKGNKGADAYAAGIELLEEGIKVQAFALFPFGVCSEWNRKKGEEFSKRNGHTVRCFDKEKIQFGEGLIIDGLLGIGLKGKPEGQVETAILLANDSKQPILAIDLPSGLDGTSGRVLGSGIMAEETVTLGCAKSGLFLREGWNHTGRLTVADFGLPSRFVDQAKEVAYLPNVCEMPLPKIARERHKYEAGYLVGYSGSTLMRGAPKLAGLAALRAGAGIVRIFHKGDIGESPMELISQKWSAKEWKRELSRANAVFVGPGLGVQPLGWMKEISLPAVFDADALQAKTKYPRRAVLTPHHGEMHRLLGVKGALESEELFARSQKFVEHAELVLVLKGAPTVIFSHGRAPLIIPRGDPGMATAGSGDVLTGIIGGLLSQKMESYDAAAVGVYLHGIAGEIAAEEKTSYGLIARDLIEFLPKAFQELL
jgi:NAD(P)H-hydrate epimerase